MWVKGSVNVVSNYQTFIKWHVCNGALKSLFVQDKNELDIHVYNLFKIIIFNYCFYSKVTCAILLQENNVGIIRIKHSSSYIKRRYLDRLLNI